MGGNIILNSRRFNFKPSEKFIYEKFCLTKIQLFVRKMQVDTIECQGHEILVLCISRIQSII